MHDKRSLPTGKLPAELLVKIIAKAPQLDARVLLGPGPGLDCAVVESGPDLLVFKSDPITFASDAIGWYAVQVSANDIATTGAIPRWLLATCLLPAGSTPPELPETIAAQLFAACQEIGVSVIGGHTEITHGINHPILVGTMIGEVPRDRLVTPRGAQPEDWLLLTKGIPIEATALLAREFPGELRDALDKTELETAKNYLYNPGISVLRDAQIAMQVGGITAMHDPTEGGLATALWELAEACGHGILVDLTRVPIPDLARRICEALELDPFGSIASGALLLSVRPEKAIAVRDAILAAGIACAEIGRVEDGPAIVWHLVKGQRTLLPRPVRDEVASLFENGEQAC